MWAAHLLSRSVLGHGERFGALRAIKDLRHIVTRAED
jgi:hypothetical protein